MKLSTFLLVPFAFFLILLASCTISDVTERPPRQPQSLSVVPLESRIALSAKINLRKVQSDLNNLIPDAIRFSGERGGCYKKNVLGVKISVGCKWNGQVQRRGTATISGSSQRLDFTVPFHAWATVRTRRFGVQETVTTDLTATATASPKLSSDWSLALNLNTDFTWDRRPTLFLFGFIPVTVGSIVQPLIKKELVKLEKKIEDEIRSQDIRGRATQAWGKIHEPIKLSGNPEVWLRLKPKAVNFSGIHMEDNILNASVSIVTDMETILGERPKAFSKSSLPDIGEQMQKIDKFLIRLPIILEYEALRKEIEKVVRVGQKWAPIRDKPHHLLTVRNVEVYPSDENFVIGISFVADLPNKWLDTRGRVYFLGKLVVDDEQREVRVDNIDFTRTTDNQFINVASLLLRDLIRNKLMSALTYRFGDEYAEFIDTANRELNRDFGDGVMSQGSLNYAKVDKVVMLGNGLYLSVISEGNLRLGLGL